MVPVGKAFCETMDQEAFEGSPTNDGAVWVDTGVPLYSSSPGKQRQFLSSSGSELPLHYHHLEDQKDAGDGWNGSPHQHHGHSSFNENVFSIEEDNPVSFWHEIGQHKDDKLVLPTWTPHDDEDDIDDDHRHFSHSDDDYDHRKQPLLDHHHPHHHHHLDDHDSLPSPSSDEDMPPPNWHRHHHHMRPVVPAHHARTDTISSWSDEDSDSHKPTVFYHASHHIVEANGGPPYKVRAPFFILAALFVAVSAIYTSRTTVTAAQDEVSKLRLNGDRIAKLLQTAEKDILMLKRDIQSLDVMVHQRTEDSELANSESQRAMKHMNDIQDRLQQEAKDVALLKTKVQDIGLREVERKFGDSVHRVEFQLIFPDKKVGPNRFVVELAPLHMMPHSVHTFLEMVSAGLLDGCSFILNALHVLKAAPLPYDGSSAALKAKAFSSHGLESVAFKEYNEKYPHKQFTVGFAADGSPSFYINTEDNSEIHIGDPCFGKVVEGFDTIRRLEACPTRNGIWFEKRVGIKYARLLQD